MTAFRPTLLEARGALCKTNVRVGLIIAFVSIFVFFPVIHILVRAFEVEGGYSRAEFPPAFLTATSGALVV